jgi:AcrR family transcriptional regulator
MTYLLVAITDALSDEEDVAEPTDARTLLERAAMALFDYIDRYPDGFRILVRDTPVVRDPEAASAVVGGTFAGLLVDVAARVDDLLASQFKSHKLNPKWAPLYSQMLVGMVAQTGQWWLDVRKPKKEEVVAHLVNLAWNGLQNLEPKPLPVPHRKH